MSDRVATVKPWWTFLIQGATAGMLLAYANLVIALQTNSRYYDFLIVGALPRFLAYGLAIGGSKGFIIWACIRLIRHRLGWLARSTIAAMAFHILVYVMSLIFPSESEAGSWTWVIGSTLVIGLTFGLLVGPRLQPWRGLVRGSATPGRRSATLAALTGVLLRLGLLFLFLFFGLVFLSVVTNPDRLLSRWVIVITIHLALSLMAVFIKMKFWLLTIAAVLINSPVVMVLTEFQREQLALVWYVLIAHVGLWALFLLTRWRQMDLALAFLNEEIHYYLID